MLRAAKAVRSAVAHAAADSRETNMVPQGKPNTGNRHRYEVIYSNVEMYLSLS